MEVGRHLGNDPAITSHIGRMGTEVVRHLGNDPMITSYSLLVTRWSGCPHHNLIM